MIKVGFVINFNSKKWLGGYNLIINLIKSLRTLKKKQIEPILIIDENVPLNELKSLNIKIIKTNYFSKEKTYQRIFNKILIHLFGKSYLYDRFFKILKINILSHTLLSLGKKSRIKSFPWIPDFQYYHYPENFSLKNRIMKKLNIFFLGKHSNKIILKNNIRKCNYLLSQNKLSIFSNEIKNLVNINLKLKFLIKITLKKINLI